MDLRIHALAEQRSLERIRKGTLAEGCPSTWLQVSHLYPLSIRLHVLSHTIARLLTLFRRWALVSQKVETR